jgi:hypothetical protein
LILQENENEKVSWESDESEEGRGKRERKGEDNAPDD